MSLLTESWPSVDTGLPQPPDESVWPYLEAAGRAVQKFGWARTTMGDIAREAGVEMRLLSNASPASGHHLPLHQQVQQQQVQQQ